MIKTDNLKCNADWEAVVVGMRNALNSWGKIDSGFFFGANPILGANDLYLMQRLIKAGSEESKFMRAITCSMDIEAPLYWWKEFDTYKIGTVSLSTSTMHKIHANKFRLENFAHDKLHFENTYILIDIIDRLNELRDEYLETKDKDIWYNMIQLLPSSYMQKRKVFMNYQVLRNIYFQRRHHKLDEWREFCECLKEFPYAKELIMLEK